MKYICIEPGNVIESYVLYFNFNGPSNLTAIGMDSTVSRTRGCYTRAYSGKIYVILCKNPHSHTIIVQ